MIRMMPMPLYDGEAIDNEAHELRFYGVPRRSVRQMDRYRRGCHAIRRLVHRRRAHLLRQGWFKTLSPDRREVALMIVRCGQMPMSAQDVKDWQDDCLSAYRNKDGE